MEKDNDILEGQTDSEEDLFDLSLDDLAPEDLEAEPPKEDPDEDIIELMELVEKGDKELSSDNGEEVAIMEDDHPTEKLVEVEDEANEISEEESDLSESDLDLSDLSLDTDVNLSDEEETDKEETALESDELFDDEKLDEETDKDIDMNIDSSPEDEEPLDDLIGEMDEDKPLNYDVEELEDREEDGDIGEVDLDTILDDKTGEDMDMTIQSPIPTPEPSEPDEESVTEEPDKAEMEKELSMEDLGGEIIQDKGIMPEESKEEDAELSGERAIGISEEKIEEILTRVVGDVVERAVRETMADVAEKVIKEAIDALKQSLEADSE